jgi:hypothetical protein
LSNAAGLPQRDRGFTLIWTGTEIIVWSGNFRNGSAKAGYEYFEAPLPCLRILTATDIAVNSDGVWYIFNSSNNAFSFSWRQG